MGRPAVWAPRPSAVALVSGGRTTPMAPRPGGWWRAEADLGPGTDYAFSLDGGPPRPDPRSPWQPAGVEGPSRTVDHGAFAWSDGGWRGLHLPSAVLYELHVGTFTPEGTFAAAAARLGHLVELGVDAVEVMPVAEFGGDRGWGYDGVDLYAPHHAYGGPDGFKQLVDACHRHGLGVVLDVVYNHLGPVGNYLAEFGPYFGEGLTTHWGAAVNLDGPDSDEVRSFLVDNALQWLRDYHVDGLRLDAVHALVDRSARHLAEELADRVRAEAGHQRRPLGLIAESDRNDPRLVRPVVAGGYGLDAVWADEFHHSLHAVLTGERAGYYEDFGSMASLARALQQGWVFAGDHSAHRRRVHGRPPGDVPGSAFVVFLQNHDQVGNRAAGDRLTPALPVGRLKAGVALTLLSPFVPLLFQGEEWGASSPFPYFSDHRDPELGRSVTEGRRREFAAFGWSPDRVPDPQDPATFAAAVLDWEEPDRPGHRTVLEWYRALLALRRARPELGDGRRDRVAVAFDEEARWLVVRRPPVAVAVNLGPDPVAAPAPGAVLLASGPGILPSPGGLVLPPDSVAVVG